MPLDISSDSIMPILFVLAVVVALASISSMTAKPSPRTFERMILEYEELMNTCSSVTNDIGEIVEEMQGKVFLSVADRDAADSLISSYRTEYNKLLIVHEKLVFYLKRRNTRYFRAYQKQMNSILFAMNDLYEKLQESNRYTKTKDEFEEMRRSREQERRMFEEEYYGDETQEEPHFEQKQKDTTPPQSTPLSGSVFFFGCSSLVDVEQRYRSLAKIYHPDMATGDKETFQRILEEYNAERNRYE